MTAREAAIAKRMAQLAELREAERACARDFLVRGHDAHLERCIFAQAGLEPCSREYDPLPYPDAEPWPAQMYEGTGVGALYGLPGCERHLWQLAGWSVLFPSLKEA